MTKPRSHYVDPENVGIYHITSRVVQRGFLLGDDPITGQNYDHRKALLLNRLKHLARFFPIKIYSYSVMDNHFHLVARYDPKEAARWSDEEVAKRWCAVFHGLPLDQTLDGPTEVEDFNFKQTLRYHELLLNPLRLEKCRGTLGSLSGFMKHFKQPFAVWANHESGTKGHFFESRFYSGALLTEQDLLTCMAYVDLNPVAAKIAKSLRDSSHTSINERLFQHRINEADLEAYLAPLWETQSEEEHSDSPTPTTSLSCTLKHYAQQLNLAIVYLSHKQTRLDDKFESWIAMLVNRERKQRAQNPALFDYA
ncbi:MAG: hypothetical protein AAF541_18435 [Pseudomonadota bacterium]